MGLGFSVGCRIRGVGAGVGGLLRGSCREWWMSGIGGCRRVDGVVFGGCGCITACVFLGVILLVMGDVSYWYTT